MKTERSCWLCLRPARALTPAHALCEQCGEAYDRHIEESDGTILATYRWIAKRARDRRVGKLNAKKAAAPPKERTRREPNGGVSIWSDTRGRWVKSDSSVVDVDCPSCHAPAGEACKGKHGPRGGTHTGRRAKAYEAWRVARALFLEEKLRARPAVLTRKTRHMPDPKEKLAILPAVRRTLRSMFRAVAHALREESPHEYVADRVEPFKGSEGDRYDINGSMPPKPKKMTAEEAAAFAQEAAVEAAKTPPLDFDTDPLSLCDYTLSGCDVVRVTLNALGPESDPNDLLQLEPKGASSKGTGRWTIEVLGKDIADGRIVSVLVFLTQRRIEALFAALAPGGHFRYASESDPETMFFSAHCSCPGPKLNIPCADCQEEKKPGRGLVPDRPEDVYVAAWHIEFLEGDRSRLLLIPYPQGGNKRRGALYFDGDAVKRLAHVLPTLFRLQVRSAASAEDDLLDVIRSFELDLTDAGANASTILPLRLESTMPDPPKADEPPKTDEKPLGPPCELCGADAVPGTVWCQKHC